MSYKQLKAKWDKLTKGWFGVVIYIVLGYIAAYATINIIGLTLNTATPVVAVFSCSMDHTTNALCEASPRPTPSNYICGKYVTNYDGSFDSFWKECGSWYESNGITKETFRSFRFTDGFSVGDMLIVYDDNKLSVGDIVVYKSAAVNYPIIHRVVKLDGDTIVTKGDRNPSPDPSVSKSYAHGKAVLVIPMLGWVKMIFTQVTGIA